MEKITGNDCNKKLSMKTNDDDKTMDDHGGQFYASSPTTGISLIEIMIRIMIRTSPTLSITTIRK
ncbi:hypothetical protein DERP_011182 [Dermatophagoides pteronyssinus]|uniref:Uncharacterized protein n=1 Tax=Dermatophagoides pteronyssinus TaxID=6956 RepID=A0ABQ8JCE7_DERPT|nr:hypothetical protein DERP_011182 [Dermatophagoides pteronyssinus]